VQQRINLSQALEWLENPVTVFVKQHIETRRQEAHESKSDVYHPFKPKRTQEIHAGLNGVTDTFDELLLEIFEAEGLEGFFDGE
jgi:hypothetical protein